MPNIHNYGIYRNVKVIDSISEDEYIIRWDIAQSIFGDTETKIVADKKMKTTANGERELREALLISGSSAARRRLGQERAKEDRIYVQEINNDQK